MAQTPIYYVSKALQYAEMRYPKIEKLALALVVAARKLLQYFQAHLIWYQPVTPLRQVLQNLDMSRRLTKWAIKLGEFDIKFMPRTTIKGQAVADFVAEFTYPTKALGGETNKPCTSERQPVDDEPTDPSNVWSLRIDGSSNVNGNGAGVVLESLMGEKGRYALRLQFPASNNEAEYKALIVGLRLAKEMGLKQVKIYSDFQLVVNQVNGDYQAKGENMVAHLRIVGEQLKGFTLFKIEQVPRAENVEADSQARIASGLEDDTLGQTLIEILFEPSTKEPTDHVMPVDKSPSWVDPIFEYLTKGKIPKIKTRLRE